MCGIFGYIGTKNAGSKILEGLKRLEYRGYDSWGIAIQAENQIYTNKNVGSIGTISSLDLPESHIGIGHTRWATCGKVNKTNAHPHFSSDKTFILAHNGIVENFKILKKSLIEKGYSFETQTDTEVIVRLIESKLKEEPKFQEAIKLAFLDLAGRNTIIILKKDSKEIFAARNGSPLVIGLGKDEIYLSSDTLSFAPFVKKIVVLDNNQLVRVKEGVSLFDIATAKQIDPNVEELNMKSDKVDKEGFDHFMLKEINESPFVVKQISLIEKEKYVELANAIKTAKTVYTIGSGTAGLAASQIAYYLRTYSGIKAISLVGGDAREYFDLFHEEDLLIAPSQSGETADVLEVLEVAKLRGAKIASHVNMQGSAITRMSDFKFLANAGPEICVMSTKIFVSQVAWGYLLAKTVQEVFDKGKQNLLDLQENMNVFLNSDQNLNQIKQLAINLKSAKDIFLMGKSQNLQIVKEGMVKLIEGSYKHAHAIPAGDLKHYAITLMEEGVPVVVVVSNDNVKTDIMNAIDEVRARGAHIIAVAPKENESFDFFIEVPDCGETSAIMSVIPLQLLSYYLTVELGNNVDKPRNIAKSVTVK